METVNTTTENGKQTTSANEKRLLREIESAADETFTAVRSMRARLDMILTCDERERDVAQMHVYLTSVEGVLDGLRDLARDLKAVQS